ncbi:ABC transporter permease [Microbacterium lacticum]|uniref:ABC transporter permease n=1 Tax=Microbacterium lacticum TaxID=33885 RepID=UPI0018B0E749|nr:ABC transporter permease [Microbacterium lacticum]MBF9337017.1 ABC transporter permease [Microbacterium lacticum]
MSAPRFAVIAVSELRLIVRNKTVLIGATLFPLALGGYLIYSREEVGRSWPELVLLQVVFFTLFTLYLTITTTLATRRNDLFLKRLRSGESSDAAILLGLVTPVVVLLAVQLGIVLIAMLIAGASAPEHLWLLAVGVFGFITTAAAVGILTGNITPSAASAQVTSLPFLTIAAGSAIWAMLAHDWYISLLPGGALTLLVYASYGTATSSEQLALALGSLLAWTVVPAVIAYRTFRWEPRR